MRLTKNAITTLKKQYRSVLLKCMAINAGLFMLAAPALAEGEYITEDIDITDSAVMINESNASQYATTGNITVGGGEITATGDSGLFQLYDTEKKAFMISDGEHNFSDSAGIAAENILGQYNGGASDLYIIGGRVTIKDGGEINVVGAADLNIGGNAEINMDYTNVAADNEHDGGILHEGQSGDINIYGGTINLSGAVAKIERGGYDGDWVYDKDGNPLMDEDVFYEKTGYYTGDPNLTEEIMAAAGIENPQNIDVTQYHVSNGNINISDGEINLWQNARISTTEKNTGDINISGGYINLYNSQIHSNDKINITGGVFTLDNSVFQSGNDKFAGLADNDMPIENAQITATDSNIESTHDINIDNSYISLVSTNPVLDDDGAGIKIEPEVGVEGKTFGIWADNNVAVTNSQINLESSYIVSNKDISVSGDATYVAVNRGSVKAINGDIAISGGLIDVYNNGEIKAHNGELNISGGGVYLNSGEIDGRNTNISDAAEINIADGWFGADEILTVSGGEINISQGGILGASPLDDNEGTGVVQITGGTINMDNGYLFSEDNLGNAGNVQISGGTINVADGDNYILTSSDVATNYISGAETVINIAETATLSAYERHSADDAIGDFADKATLNLLDNAAINLNGTLVANVNGTGDVNINSNAAQFDGTMKGVNLNVDADIVLNTDNVDQDMGALNVKSGTLTLAGNNSDYTSFAGINVQNGATLEISDADVKTTAGTDVIVNGTLNLDNAVLEAGNDADNVANNSNMQIDYATVTATDSDIEVNGNLTINDSSIDLAGSGDMYADNADVYGIWADGDIELNGDNVIILNNSYIGSNGDIVINGGRYESTGANDSMFQAQSITFKDGYEMNMDFCAPIVNIEGGESNTIRDVYEARPIELGDDLDYLNIKGGHSTFINEIGDGIGHINISGGQVDMTNSELDGLYVNISGGEINLEGSEDIETNLYARKNYDITGGTVNMNGYAVMDNIADIRQDAYDKYDLNISGGTINISGVENEISSAKEINFSGGTINIQENAKLGMYGGNDEESTTVNFGKDAVYNIGGTLNTNFSGNGSVYITSDQAQINGNIALTDGGVLQLDTNKLTVNGDAAFEKGSKLSLIFTSKDKVGQIDAENITVSNQDTTLDLSFNDAAVEDEGVKVQILHASQDFVGAFATITENSEYNITDEGNGLYNIRKKSAAPDPVIPDEPEPVIPDVQPVAPEIIDAGDTWNNLDTKDTNNQTTVAVAERLTQLRNHQTSAEAKQAYVDALTALAPETAPMTQQVSTETANQVFGAVGTRLSGGPVASSRQGMSSGDASGHEGAVWLQMMYNKSKLDDTSKSKGFDSDTTGVALGIEKYFSPAIKAGIGYAYSKSDVSGFLRDTDIKTHTALVYGEYKPNNWFINGIATYGWSDYGEDKNVAGIGVKADYDVEAMALQLMTGYDMNLNGYGLTPETGLRYVHIDNKAYTNSVDERVNSSDSDIVTGVIGARLNKTFAISRNTLLKPEVRAAMTYDLANDDSKSVVTLVNDSSYSVSGKSLNRFGVELGAGLTTEINDNIELFIGYEGKFRSDYQDHSGLINAKYKF